MTERIVTDLGWHFEDLHDFEFHLAIVARWVPASRKRGAHWLGAPFSWKRARKIVTFRGRPSLALTKEAKAWATEAALQLWTQWSQVFPQPIPKCVLVNAAIVSYLPTRALTDASNLYQGPEDVMQIHKGGKKPCNERCNLHAGILEDDCCIQGHDGSDRLYDKSAPRVEITLTPYRGKARAKPQQLEL